MEDGIQFSRRSVPVAILTKSGRSTFSQDVSAARATASRVSSKCGDRLACFVCRQPIAAPPNGISSKVQTRRRAKHSVRNLVVVFCKQ
uniref:Uncharacterized protein n=1 Tax=Zea mays TaxID=4577 RepID=C4J1M3_MAIZE|nr:unknown [Zea mays]